MKSSHRPLNLNFLTIAFVSLFAAWCFSPAALAQSSSLTHDTSDSATDVYTSTEAYAGNDSRVTSLGSLLKSDGTLRRDTGFIGSLDARGFRMETGANGEPRFVVQDAKTDDGVMPLAAGDEKWDDRFGFTGVNGRVYAIAVAPNGDFYVGGDFTQVGGSQIPNAYRVARWDGRRWHALGNGISSDFNCCREVYAFALRGDELFVGGNFNLAGGVAAKNIARWNITTQTWSAVGSGVGTDGTVRTIAVLGNDIYVGGRFTVVDGVTVNGIARWNGAWSPLGRGLGDTYSDGTLYNGGFFYADTIVPSGGVIYVGGYFPKAATTTGTIVVNSVASWNGANWSAFDKGVTNRTSFVGTGRVSALAVDGNDVYVGGEFEFSGDVRSNSIARWNGTSWSALGSGTNGFSGFGRVTAAAFSGGLVYVGGSWSSIGGVTANGIAKWDGNAWSPLGVMNNGIPDNVNIIVSKGNGRVYVGGDFVGDQVADNRIPNSITEWNGTEFLAFGEGVNSNIFGTVHAAAITATGDVYVGGQFSHVGGIPAKNVARWNGSDWSALGDGIDGLVYAVAIIGNDVYFGGGFDRAGAISAKNIARWNIAGSSWSALGGGTDSVVRALAVSGNTLFVGGGFTAAGSTNANGVARWDGANWSKLGASSPGFGFGFPRVYALITSGTLLFIGGDFSCVSFGGGSCNATVNSVVIWDSATDGYFRLGEDDFIGVRIAGSFGDRQGSVNAFAIAANQLFVGGNFEKAGDTLASAVARYNFTVGKWLPLDTGVSSSVSTCSGDVTSFAVVGNDIYVGGCFDSAGTTDARSIARWNIGSGAWSKIGSGITNLRRTDEPPPTGNVNALITNGNSLYAGGNFSYAGLLPSASFARYALVDGVVTTPIKGRKGRRPRNR